jgi:CRP-like cAMP-binding protein
MLSGQVKVFKGDAELSTLGQGEHFGEMALIRSQPRSADVMAETKSEIIAINRTDFFDILRKEHEMAVKLLWQFLGVLADRLDRTTKDLRTAREEMEIEDITADIFRDEQSEDTVSAEEQDIHSRPTIPNTINRDRE